MTDNRRGNGRDRQQIQVQRKTPTRDDLNRAAEAAQVAAEASAIAADSVLSALEDQEHPGQGDGNRGHQQSAGSDSDTPPQQPIAIARTRSRIPSSESAAITGFGTGVAGPRQPDNAPLAFEAFMAALKQSLDQAGERVTVSENAGWVILEGSRNHQRVLIAKSKTVVTRVASTFEPELIQGAAHPDRQNGRIASWLPADPQVVGEAIRLLATSDEHIRPPLRGGGGGGGGTEQHH